MKKFFLFPFLFIFNALSYAQTIDRLVAVVGDQAILQSDIQNDLNTFQKSPSLAQIFGMSPSQISFEKILELKIQERIVRQSLRDAGADVKDAEVETQISKIASQNGLSRLQLVEQLKSENIPFDLYSQNIRAQIERRNVFDREIRQGGGVTEAELRNLYQNVVGNEYEITLLSLSPGPQSTETLVQLRKKIEAGSTTLDLAKQSYPKNELGWMALGSMQKDLRAAVEKDKESRVAGPVAFNGFVHLVLMENKRAANDAGFEKARPALMAQAQAQDFEKRFHSWIETKKRSLHIIVNK